MRARPLRIAVPAGPGPKPPLAGALGAFWLRGGGDGAELQVVPGASADGDWVHCEALPGGQAGEPSHAPCAAGVAPVFFGPGVDAEVARSALLARWPRARFVLGDPEGAGSHGPAVAGSSCVGRVEDLGSLPITTWEGFGLPRGSAVRVLAGRGDRARPVVHFLREIVYLCEMLGTRELLFDDEDLGHYGDWLSQVEDELRRLPWPISWTGTEAGLRRKGRGRGE